jgi:hypothetical protein
LRAMNQESGIQAVAKAKGTTKYLAFFVMTTNSHFKFIDAAPEIKLL